MQRSSRLLTTLLQRRAPLAPARPLATMASKQLPTDQDIAAIELEDARNPGGPKVRLGDLWKDKPVSVTFLRR